ncbi:MAG TPA: SDR family NAD(P)-dependent oxidoreductase [Jatrophihabitans sp.]|nr:SDR family NAD(P)-dependent oxidoreductase [Jatrophihabitans sp.]
MTASPEAAHWHAIVTGGSSGIGLALVRRLVASGVPTSVIALDDADLAALRHALPAVTCVAADVSDRVQAQAAVAECVAARGPCDLLVTSAGVITPGYFAELADVEFERQMQVNYFGTLWPIRAVAGPMIEAGGGSIVAISSFGGLMGVFGMGAYGPSKYAVRGLCETLRLELGPHGIHVLAVYPTDVDTPMLAREKPLHPPEENAMQGTIKPMSPDVVADTILDALRRRRARLYPGRRNALLAHLVMASPALATKYAEVAVARARPASRAAPR